MRTTQNSGLPEGRAFCIEPEIAKRTALQPGCTRERIQTHTHAMRYAFLVALHRVHAYRVQSTPNTLYGFGGNVFAWLIQNRAQQQLHNTCAQLHCTLQFLCSKRGSGQNYWGKYDCQFLIYKVHLTHKHKRANTVTRASSPVANLRPPQKFRLLVMRLWNKCIHIYLHILCMYMQWEGRIYVVLTCVRATRARRRVANVCQTYKKLINLRLCALLGLGWIVFAPARHANFEPHKRAWQKHLQFH